jgi:hypothetical protein
MAMGVCPSKAREAFPDQYVGSAHPDTDSD